MKAIQISAYGDADQLHQSEVAKPRPQEHQVLVSIHDAGVNPYDWKVRSGMMKDVMPVKFPLTLGYDFAGVVSEVGEAVHRFRAGDRVFGFAQGAYAEYALASQDKIAPIPADLNFVTAAALPTPGLTAYQIVVRKVQARSGQRILIHGAAGAVGSLAVQMARIHGAEIFANAAGSDHDYLRELGVQHLIDFKTQRFEDFAENVDVVIDLVGGETLRRSLDCVKKGGLVITTVGPWKEELAAQRGVQGQMHFTDQNSADLEALATLVASGRVRPRVEEVMPLEKAAAAQQMSESGRTHGKIVLQVSP